MRILDLNLTICEIKFVWKIRHISWTYLLCLLLFSHIINFNLLLSKTYSPFFITYLSNSSSIIQIIRCSTHLSRSYITSFISKLPSHPLISQINVFLNFIRLKYGVLKFFWVTAVNGGYRIFINIWLGRYCWLHFLYHSLDYFDRNYWIKICFFQISCLDISELWC